MLNKNLLIAVAAALLCMFFFQQETAVWVLFFGISLYHFYLLIGRKYRSTKALANMESIRYGELGEYVVDGDESYGLYLRLCGWDVSVDIRKDELLEARKDRACALFANSALLERSAQEFIEATPRFKDSRIASIGLHAPDIEQCEVFWEPDGYTLLRGYTFVPE